MKIIVCGKGGSGKSTVAALIARQNAAGGERCVVVDTDVSNTGIHRILGASPTEDLVRLFRIEDDDPGEDGGWTCETLPPEHISERDGVRLITIGKINVSSKGCKCSVSNVARRFIERIDVGTKGLVVVDTEAGVEHFGRGLDSLCDVVVMVVDPTFESLALLEKIAGMTAAIQVPLALVLNKTDSATGASLRESLGARYPILGELPSDPVILSAGLRGQPLPRAYAPALPLVASLGAFTATAVLKN